MDLPFPRLPIPLLNAACPSVSLSLSSSVQFVIGFNGKEMCNLTGVAVEPTTSVFILSLTRPCLDKIP